MAKHRSKERRRWVIANRRKTIKQARHAARREEVKGNNQNAIALLQLAMAWEAKR